MPHEWPVTQTESIHRSAYLNLSIDTVMAPDHTAHERSVVEPNGAVGVVALDDAGRVLLVEQYRHPVRMRMQEIPAGTLDVAGEPAADAAARELAEEADITAATWTSILRAHATPGYSSESWEVFLATDLTPLPEAERHQREAEEADMAHWWVHLDDALDGVVAGRITDAMTVAALLMVARSRP